MHDAARLALIVLSRVTLRAPLAEWQEAIRVVMAEEGYA